MTGYPYKAKQRIEDLIERLEVIVERDPEQDVLGMAIPVVDAVLTEVKAAIGSDDAVVNMVEGVISPESIARGEPVRAIDVLPVAGQLDAAIGPRPMHTVVSDVEIPRGVHRRH